MDKYKRSFHALMSVMSVVVAYSSKVLARVIVSLL